MREGKKHKQTNKKPGKVTDKQCGRIVTSWFSPSVHRKLNGIGQPCLPTGHNLLGCYLPLLPPKKRQGCMHWYSLSISLLPQTICYENLPFLLPQYSLSHLLRRAANTKILEKPFPVACQYKNRQPFSSLHCLSTTSLQETHLPCSLVPSLIWGEAPFSMGADAAPPSSPAPALPHSPCSWLPSQVSLRENKKKKHFIYSPTPA